MRRVDEALERTGGDEGKKFVAPDVLPTESTIVLAPPRVGHVGERDAGEKIVKPVLLDETGEFFADGVVVRHHEMMSPGWLSSHRTQSGRLLPVLRGPA